MAKIFITLTGTKHYFGNDFLEKGMKIRLEKEPDNELLSLSGSCMVIFACSSLLKCRSVLSARFPPLSV